MRRVMVTALTPDDRARRRAVHARGGRRPCSTRSRTAQRRRPRRRVHCAAAEPRHRAPARVPGRGRRPRRPAGEGADGERVPAAEPHRARRGLRQRVSRVRGVHRRADRRTRAVARARRTRARDVVSRLVELEIDGVRLSRTQARALTRNLITGGLTTTSQLLGNLLHQILTVPGLDARRACRRRGARTGRSRRACA